MIRWREALLWVTTACGLVSCGPDDQPSVLVRLSAAPSFAPDADVVRVRVTSRADPSPGPVDHPRRGSELLVEVPLVPSDGDRSRSWEVEVQLVDGVTDEVLATHRVAGSFEAEFTGPAMVNARFDESTACAERACGAGRTCVQGECVGSCYPLRPYEVDPVDFDWPRCGTCQQCESAACVPFEGSCGCGRCADGECVGTFSEVDVNVGHACAIRQDTTANELYCWGNNHAFRAGGERNGDDAAVAPLAVPEASSALAVATAEAATCVLTTTGDQRCWGWTANHGFGLGAASGRSVESSEAVEGSTTATAIAAGQNDFCLVGAAGASCFGNNSSGIVDPNGESPARTPVDRGGLEEVSIGRAFACGRDGGEVLCWGTIPGGSEEVSPTRVMSAASAPLDGVVALDVGRDAACAVDVDGALWCWGDLSELGYSSDAPLQARRIESEQSFADVAVAQHFACAVTATAAGEPNELYCFGIADTLLMPALRSVLPTRVTVTGSERWERLAGRRSAMCGIRGGRLFCWGDPTTSCVSDTCRGDLLGRSDDDVAFGEPSFFPIEVATCHGG